MYARVNPEQPSDHNPLLIHAKPLDRSSPDWRQALNATAAVNPDEVLNPGLSTRVEQRNASAAFRIEGIGGVALRQVTGSAGQRQVIGVVATIWDDVIDVHGLADDALAGAAVFAAVPCPLMDQADCGSPR